MIENKPQCGKCIDWFIYVQKLTNCFVKRVLKTKVKVYNNLLIEIVQK